MIAPLERATIGLIGCGNMGRAMLNGWLGAGIAPGAITVVDPSNPLLPSGVRGIADIAALNATPDILILAVKPQMLSTVAPALSGAVTGTTVLVSVLAGTTVATLQRHFPAAHAIVRVMPNLPASIGAGVSAVFTQHPDAEVRLRATQLVAPLGQVEWIADEALFDAVTALSGCGPGFVFRFIETMAHGGAALGLPADQAMRLALATVRGAALMAAQSEEDVATLANRVASPGGSTRAGLNVLDDDRALGRLIAATLAAAEARNAALARESSG